MLDAIRAVKRGQAEAPRATLAAAARALGRRGAASILIGCSEFSLLADAVPAELRPVDSLDALVGAILRAAGAQPGARGPGASIGPPGRPPGAEAVAAHEAAEGPLAGAPGAAGRPGAGTAR